MAATPYNEAAIGGADLIIRRINPVQHVVPDQNRNCLRISTKAYAPSSGPDGGMSIDIESLILNAGLPPAAYVTDPVFLGSVAFSAAQIRALGLWVGYDPVPSNPYHGEVWGQPRPNRFTGAQKNGLAATAKWYVQISGVELT